MAVLTFAALILWQSYTFPEDVQNEAYGPASYPKLISWVLGALVLGFLHENRKAIEESPLFTWDKMKLPLVVGGEFLLLLLLLEPLGFVVSGLLFLVAAMRSLATKWKTSLIVSGCLVAAIFIMFDIILDVPVPKGSLWEMLS